MRTIQDMIQQEIQVCVSSLVSTLAAGANHNNDDMPTPDLDSLAEQAYDLAAPVEDWREAARQEGFDHGGDNGGFWFNKAEFGTWKAAASSDDASTYDSAQEACEANDIEPYRWDVYEHWAVSPWLAEKLIEQGERVDTDFAGLNVWARTTTGQAIRADAVIERIYAAAHKQDAA